jgi:hypothetical protein
MGISSLAMDATYLYFSNEGDGTIKKVLKTGGIPTTLATGQGYAQSLATDGVNVYWGSYTDKTLRRTSVSAPPCNVDCAILATDQGNISGIALDANAIYWTDQMGTTQSGGAGTVMRLAK